MGNKGNHNYPISLNLMFYRLYIKFKPYQVYENQFRSYFVLFVGYFGYTSQSRDETLSIVR
jgi:hypothetical protein